MNIENSNVLNDLAEYEDGTCDIKVSGRLKSHQEFWHKIGAPDFILDIVKYGYVIPFYDLPPNQFSRNNKSALDNGDFVTRAISDLVKLGTVEVCHIAPHVINPLTVSVQSNGKKRLILDLRLVNQFIHKKSVKFEDMRTALLFLKKGGYMFKFDLKSGYHHVDIHPSHQTFLGFKWTVDGKSTMFRFTSLPFGLSSAAFLFTKTVRPLVKKWRSEGKNIVVFLDDGLGFADSFVEANSVSEEIKADLIASGFVPNVQKSIWLPTQYMEWLGYSIDTQSGSFKVLEKRVQDIYQSCLGMLDSLKKSSFGRVSARLLASITGKIVSTGLAVGNMSSLMTKAMHVCIETKANWHSFVHLSTQAVEELKFWIENIRILNNNQLEFKPSATRIAYSDASSTGYGGYVIGLGDDIAHGLWPTEEMKTSSTWRELRAVDLVMQSLVGKLSNHRIKWFTDNQAVAKIAKQGSMKPDLHNIALDICGTCVRHNISLEVEWIPRAENDRADFISRIVDSDDWAIADSVFNHFDHFDHGALQ
ncbi:uncharacterized protein [Amphiura filiformis]|uniref:uncharacterized protein n=1 Tax=Amphiura filiformis TaxID=82378 RepID=UPI003B213BFC